MTSHLRPGRIVPLICRTILAKSQNRQPMLFLPLLFAGMPISTYRMGESVSHNAIVGMLPSADSLIGCTKFSRKHIIISIAEFRTHRCISTVLFWHGSSPYLVVGPWVSDDEQTGLAEGGLHLVGEGTGGMPSRDGVGAGVLRELEDGALAVGARGLDDDVLRVLDGDDDSRRELKLLPCLSEVDDVDAYDYRK
jgi:hypothetical protein